jgi:hypothetical protein
MTLLDLAERAKLLTESCREMDLAIMQAISGHPWRWADSRTFEPQTVITWDQYGEGAAGNPFYTLEEFTASLDAAMTLVPEGLPILVRDGYDDAPGDKRPYAHIMTEIGEGYAATKTLAIVVASLRARSALEASHD